MQEIGNIFNIALLNPITNIFIGIYQGLVYLNIPYPLGFAIIGLTVIIRVILIPFTSAQIRSAYKMQKAAPHMAVIREKHKSDKKRQQEEMMKLYKKLEINPAAGCLPLLIQLPIIWSLYNVLNQVVGSTSKAAILKINGVLYYSWLKIDPNVWNTQFFGLPLATSPSKLLSVAPLIVLIPVITGVLQFILSKMMLPHPDDVPTKTDKMKNDDFQSAFQKQSLYIFPVMIGFFSFTLPVGLSLYWNTFTLFGIIQQYVIVGPGGAYHWVEKAKTYGKRKK